MFRPATIKEVECLLRSCGKELVRPPSAARPHPNPDGGGGGGVAESADKVRGDHGSLLAAAGCWLLAAGCSPIVVVEYQQLCVQELCLLALPPFAIVMISGGEQREHMLHVE
jgi:hypothetical protein